MPQTPRRARRRAGEIFTACSPSLPQVFPGKWLFSEFVSTRPSQYNAGTAMPWGSRKGSTSNAEEDLRYVDRELADRPVALSQRSGKLAFPGPRPCRSLVFARWRDALERRRDGRDLGRSQPTCSGSGSRRGDGRV